MRSQLDFSNEQANIYKKELEDREEELAEFKRNYQKSSIDKGLSNEDNLRGIESEIDNVKYRDLVETNDRLSFLESQLKSSDIDPTDLNMPVELNVSKRLLLDQTTTLAQLMEKYTWRDAKVNAQRRQIESSLDSPGSSDRFLNPGQLYRVRFLQTQFDFRLSLYPRRTGLLHTQGRTTES